MEMRLNYVLLVLFIVDIVVPLTFIFASHWWAGLHVKELMLEKKLFGSVSFLRKTIDWELKFVKSGKGKWFYRLFGIIWLIVSFVIFTGK